MAATTLRRAARAARDELRDLAHPAADALIDALSRQDDEALADSAHELLLTCDDLEPSLGLARLERALYGEHAA